MATISRIDAIRGRAPVEEYSAVETASAKPYDFGRVFLVSRGANERIEIGWKWRAMRRPDQHQRMDRSRSLHTSAGANSTPLACALAEIFSPISFRLGPLAVERETRSPFSRPASSFRPRRALRAFDDVDLSVLRLLKSRPLGVDRAGSASYLAWRSSM